MTRTSFFALAMLVTLVARAGTYTLHVTARGFGEDVVSLYRYDEPFTNRTFFVARNLLGADGTTILEGEAESTLKVQLRIGDRTADLFVRPGSVLYVEPYDLGTARSMNGTTRMGINFTNIDPLDINALTTDVNERIDAFIDEDLATDQAAGMQVLDIQRKERTQQPDSTDRPPTLFVTPVLSKEKLDTFELKLRRFYADVNDPWFAHYLDYSMAGLHVGPRLNERDLFETHVKGKPVLYDDPEYVRLIRNLFTDGLEQIDRYHGDTLALLAANGKMRDLRALFQRNDFLRTDDRLAELVMIDQLYLNHAAKLVAPRDAETILMDVLATSTFPEHRRIADNMLWDLMAMRVGTMLPEVQLEDERGQRVVWEGLLQGPTCIAITAGWCTYCASEIAGLAKLGNEYPDAVKIIVIDLDRTTEEFLANKKASPTNSFMWLHAVAEQQLREEFRLRSLPAFYLLNDDVLARSPAPMPSQGLGALFLQARIKAEKGKQIKVWDD